ncbi:MAG: Isopentenyl phosphate kinase [Methanonatronarchaeales archaeon]|nr:Isopentenyl phosphate kinase [Methanonatronarchaeales archaeon]
MRVLKIGGSVLTDKEGKEALRRGATARVAGELAAGPEDLVLVHGAGSFGHPHVDEYLSGGPEDRLLGASVTHRAVSELTQLLVGALVEQRVPALPVRPLSCCLAKGGRIEEMFLGAVNRMLESGVMPVLHGDVVVSEGDVTVVSGDEVLAQLAERFDASSVGFGTDVDGVLNADGEVIDFVDGSSIDEIEFYGGSGIDATGGMENKVRSLMRLGLSGFVFNASVPGNVERFLKGERIGTEVSP